MQKNTKEIPVLFENDYCMVLNKPSGLAVQGGEGVKISLDSILTEKYSERPLLVHRLDRDTSGLILVAKTKEAAAFFSALLGGGRGKGQNNDKQNKRVVVKRYLGICAGKPGSGVIKQNLDVRGMEKAAETYYRFLSSANIPGTFDVSDFSLLELELGTGRMHQIRRHLS